MATEQSNKAPEGFEEIPLPEGFEEVPIEQPAAAPEQSFPVEASTPDISKAQSATTGAIQGATMGFSDEIGGGVDALGDFMQGKGLGKYREYQKLREEANKRDQEANPWSYAGGELAGGIGSAVLTPGLGTARVIAGAGKLSPRLAQFLAGSSKEAMAIKEALSAGKIAPEAAEAALKAAPQVGTLAKIAGKGSAMAIEGAPIGAAYGAGSSEKTIEGNPSGLLKDTAIGMGMGSLGGLAIGAGVEGGKAILKGAGNYAKNNDTLRQLGVAFDKGDRGLNLGNSDVENKMTGLPRKKAGSLTHSLLAAKGEVGDLFGEVLKTAEANNVLVKSELGSFSPQKAQEAKELLYKELQSLSKDTSQEAFYKKEKVINLIKSLESSMKNDIPGYAEISKDFANVSKIPETIISKGTPDDFNTIYFGKLKDKENKLYNASKDMLEGATLSGKDTAEARDTFEVLRKKFNELQKTNPEILHSIGDNAASINNKLQSHADQIAMQRLAYGSDPKVVPDVITDTLRNTSKILLGSKAPTVGLANKIGLLKGGVRRGSTKLVNASKDQLANLSNYLIGNKSTEAIGKKLADALSRNDDVGKNTALFVLMQNPGYRDMLREQGFEVGEGNE